MITSACYTQAGVRISNGPFTDLAALQAGIWCTQGAYVSVMANYLKGTTLCAALERGAYMPVWTDLLTLLIKKYCSLT